MKSEIHIICAQLGLALLNGVYQGLVLTAGVGALLRFLARTNAATRHAVWLASLALVILMIPAHYFLDSIPQTRGSLPKQPIHEDSPSWGYAETSLPAQDAPLPSAQPISQNPIPIEDTFLLPGSLPIPDPAIPNASDPAPASQLQPTPPNQLQGFAAAPAAQGFHSDAAGPVEPPSQGKELELIPPDEPGGILARFVRPVSWNLESALGQPFLLALLFLWFAGAGARLLVLVCRVRQLRKLTEGSSSPDREFSDLFDELRAAARVARKVQLRLSTLQRCPVVLGFFHPVILLPVEMAKDSAEARQVLCHELAHVRRYDDWVNLLQHFAQALLFFDPAVWWIGKRLSLEREIACDDHVLQQGTGRRNYALMLTNVASRMNQQTPVLAPGVSNSHSQLQQRISMILNTRRNSSPCLATGRLTSIVAAAALLAVLALYSAPRVVLADSSAQTAGPAIAGSTAAGVVSSGEPGPEPAAASSAAVVFVQADEPTPPGPRIDPAPKFKPGRARNEPREPIEVDAGVPEAPEAPSVEMTPGIPAAPRVARAPKAGRAPRIPEPPDAMNSGDGSIEERLQRLEKMVHSMMDQQGIKRSHGMNYNFNDSSEMWADRDKQKLEKLKEFSDRQNDMFPEQKRKEMAERQANRAADQAQRAVEQVKRANKDIQARLEQEHLGQGELRETLQRQLEGLRKARESLGQEMEKLNRQIEKIERDQQKSDRGQQRRSEASSEKLQAENPIPEIAR